MKAQTFLELVGEMMDTQGDYFQAKRAGLLRAKDLLIKAKGLEKRVRVVVQEGSLEPDEGGKTADAEIFTEDGFWERMSFMDELEAEDGDDEK